MRSFGRVDLIVGQADAEEHDRRVEHPTERLLRAGAALTGERRRDAPHAFDRACRGGDRRMVERGERRRDRRPSGVTTTLDTPSGTRAVEPLVERGGDRGRVLVGHQPERDLERRGRGHDRLHALAGVAGLDPGDLGGRAHPDPLERREPGFAVQAAPRGVVAELLVVEGERGDRRRATSSVTGRTAS